MASRNKATQNGKEKIDTIIVPELEKLIGSARNKAWSEYEVKVLSKYYSLDVPVKDIAQYLKRTIVSVQKKITTLNLRRT